MQNLGGGVRERCSQTLSFPSSEGIMLLFSIIFARRLTLFISNLIDAIC